MKFVKIKIIMILIMNNQNMHIIFLYYFLTEKKKDVKVKRSYNEDLYVFILFYVNYTVFTSFF